MTSFYRNIHTHKYVDIQIIRTNQQLAQRNQEKQEIKKVHAERNNGKSCNYLCKSLVDIFVQISSFLAFFYFICDACSA